MEYLVRWYGHATPTWEPQESFDDIESVNSYHRRVALPPVAIRDTERTTPNAEPRARSAVPPPMAITAATRTSIGTTYSGARDTPSEGQRVQSTPEAAPGRRQGERGDADSGYHTPERIGDADDSAHRPIRENTTPSSPPDSASPVVRSGGSVSDAGQAPLPSPQPRCSARPLYPALFQPPTSDARPSDLFSHHFDPDVCAGPVESPVSTDRFSRSIGAKRSILLYVGGLPLPTRGGSWSVVTRPGPEPIGHRSYAGTVWNMDGPVASIDARCTLLYAHAARHALTMRQWASPDVHEVVIAADNFGFVHTAASGGTGSETSSDADSDVWGEIYGLVDGCMSRGCRVSFWNISESDNAEAIAVAVANLNAEVHPYGIDTFGDDPMQE